MAGEAMTDDAAARARIEAALRAVPLKCGQFHDANGCEPDYPAMAAAVATFAASERAGAHAPSAEDMARVILDWRETASTLLAERDAARQEAEMLRRQRDDEAWGHAACLSIAEGVTGWETCVDASPAVIAVKRLRALLGAAQEALRKAIAELERFPSLGYAYDLLPELRAALAAGLPPSKTDTLKETL